MLWSDEAKFHTNGVVNRHNCRYWREEPPDISCERTAIAPGVVAWCGLWYNDILGPLFFDGSVNGENYLQLLDTVVIPFMEEHDEMSFQQDGAPAHFARIVQNRLNEKLSGRWMRRRGTTEWPERSPWTSFCGDI